MAAIFCSTNAFSQQNLFNVPTGDVVEKGKFFFQEQFNFNDAAQSSSTFDYGVAEKFEIGLNLLNINVAKFTKEEVSEENALATVNVLYRAFDNGPWALSIGTQAGAVALGPDQRHMASFNYFVNHLKTPDEKFSFIVGGYWANAAFLTWHNQAGAMLGTEIKIVKDKLDFNAEWISGNHGLSGFIPGLVFYPIVDVALSLGVRIPNAQAQSHAIVFNFTAIKI